MLDAFADARRRSHGARSTVTGNNPREELADLDRSAQEKLRLADLWSFQRKEIEAVAPQPGEDAALENERRVLRNVVRLEETANAAYAALYDAPESVTAQLRLVVRRLEELARIDPASPTCWRPCSPPPSPSMKPPTLCAIICRSSKPIPAAWRKWKRAWRLSKN